MGARCDIASLIPFYAGVKDGFYADARHARGSNHHILTGIDLGNRNVDEFFGSGFWHELIAVPLLKFLDSRETDGFFVPAVEGDMYNVFARSSRHFKIRPYKQPAYR